MSQPYPGVLPDVCFSTRQQRAPHRRKWPNCDRNRQQRQSLCHRAWQPATTKHRIVASHQERDRAEQQACIALLDEMFTMCATVNT